MLFEPENLLLLAKRTGLSLFRRGNLLVIVPPPGGAVPAVWAETLKHHKAALLPMVPTEPPAAANPALPTPRGKTADMFAPEPDTAPPARAKQGARRKPPAVAASGDHPHAENIATRNQTKRNQAKPAAGRPIGRKSLEVPGRKRKALATEKSRD